MFRKWHRLFTKGKVAAAGAACGKLVSVLAKLIKEKRWSVYVWDWIARRQEIAEDGSAQFVQCCCSVLITIATSLCYHADHLYCNVVKLLHDVKVLVLCESRMICTECKE